MRAHHQQLTPVAMRPSLSIRSITGLCDPGCVGLPRRQTLLRASMNSVIHTHLTRRKLLALGIAAGTTPELLIKLNGSMGQSGHLSESVLIEASELSGEI